MGKETAAIASLYAGERLRLQRRFQRRGASPAAAADLVQESFARLLRSRTEEIHDLRAYLYRAADSAERDMRRAEIRTQRLIDPGATPDAEVVDPSPPVEAALIRDEDRLALTTAIDSLPCRPREVLLLHRFENMSYAEIAERLGISRNTVMVHMVRALGLLRGRLGGLKDERAQGQDGTGT